MTMRKIKIGDLVTVLSGKDKKRTGKVLKYLSYDRILVEGVNMVKKHVKANPNNNTQGGILERESGIHVSNVALLNPTTNKVDRVGFKRLEDGTKVRYFKSNGEMVEA